MPKLLEIIHRHLPLTIHHPSPHFFLLAFKTMLVFIIIIIRVRVVCVIISSAETEPGRNSCTFNIYIYEFYIIII